MFKLQRSLLHRPLIERDAEIQITAARRPVVRRSVVNRRRGIYYRGRGVNYRRGRIVYIIARPVRIGAIMVFVMALVMVLIVIAVVVMLMMPVPFPGHAVVRHSEHEGYQDQKGYKYFLHDSSPLYFVLCVYKPVNKGKGCGTGIKCFFHHTPTAGKGESPWEEFCLIEIGYIGILSGSTCIVTSEPGTFSLISLTISSAISWDLRKVSV